MAEKQLCPGCDSPLRRESREEAPRLTQYKRKWQRAMLGLNAVYVAIIIAAWSLGWPADPLTGGWRLWLVDVVFCTLFGIDYYNRMRFCAADDRVRYAFQLDNLLDIVVIMSPLPALFGLTSLGALRVLRLLKSGWSVVGRMRPTVHDDMRRLFTQQNIRYALNLAVTVSIVAFAIVYSAETAARPTPGIPGSRVASVSPGHTIGDPFDGAWWLVETVTTVGYGDTQIETTLGRVAAMVIMAIGIVVFGLATAWVASIFVGKEDDREHQEILNAVWELKGILGGQPRPEAPAEDVT